MITTSVPGIKAKHAIIGPNCRRFTVPRPGLHPEPTMAAFNEAMERLRGEYAAICEGRDDDWIGHLVLTVETP